MRSINSLVWRNLSAHPLRSILTAMAITLGVAMVLAASIVGQAASASASELSQEGPRVDLEVFSRDGLPFGIAVLDTLLASPDVDLASPSLRVEVVGITPEIPDLTLLGVDPESYFALYQPELANGTFLDGPETIVLPMRVAIDNGLNVGAKITLGSNGRTSRLTVAGRLKLEQDIAALTEEAIAYVPLEVAQTLQEAQGRIARIAVTLRSGADPDRVRETLIRDLPPNLTVVRTDLSGGLQFDLLLVQGGMAMVGVIILFAAGFVILNAFAMSVTGRTREIGALRALGMTRRQVLRQVLAEASILGLIGVALGALAGIGLAYGVMRAVKTLQEVGFAVPWWGAALSIGMGLAVTLIGALQPALRASRVSPLVAVRAQRAGDGQGWYVRHGGRVGGALLIALLVGLSTFAFIWQPDLMLSIVIVIAGMAGLLISTILLLPALVDPMIRLVRPFLVRWLGTSGRLAADNLGRNKLRAVLTAGALMAVLTTIIASSGLLASALKGGLHGYGRLFNEDILIIPDILALVRSGEISLENTTELVTTGAALDQALLERVGALGQSGDFEVCRIGFAPIPPALRPYPGAPGAFIDPEIFIRIGNFDFFEGDADSALAWMERGRAMLLQPVAAERLGVAVGDTVSVDTRQGEVAFTVAGIGGIGYNFTAFSFSDGETYFGLERPSWLGIVVSEGRDTDAVLARIEQEIDPFEDVTAAKVATAFYQDLFQVIGQFQALLNGFLLLAVVVASLGVVNTMVINVAERRREIALLRAVGATQRQARQAVVAEAAALGLMAALAATGISVVMLLLFVLVMAPGGTESMGVRADWEMAKNVLKTQGRDLVVASALATTFGPLVAALAAYYPAKRAAAMDVVEATRSERVALGRARLPRQERRHELPRSFTWTMAWRNLDQARTRSTLSALTVALGVAMIVAANVIANASRSAIQAADERNLGALVSEVTNVALVLVGLVILIAAGFVVFNAFAMAVTQRRRQIGMLRSLGMTRRQIMRLVLLEAIIAGGVGTLLGLVGGPLLGRGLIALLRLAGEMMNTTIAVFGEPSTSWPNLLAAGALGLGITLFSILIPAWQAARVSPLTALRERAASGIGRAPVGRVLVGVLIIGALFLYLVVAPPGAWAMPPWNGYLSAIFALLWLISLGLALPALVNLVSSLAKTLFVQVWGAIGRLVADNVRRSQRRVALTILTLAVGLTTIVCVTGVMTFMINVLVGTIYEESWQGKVWAILPVEFEDMAQYASSFNVDTMHIPADMRVEIHELASDRATTVDLHMVSVPELAFYPGIFSYALDPEELWLARDRIFSFTEGDWAGAMPIMRSGCGVLIAPAIAARNEVSPGDAFEVTGPLGPVECTVAGIGRSSFANVSIVSLSAREAFGLDENQVPGTLIDPLPGTDIAVLEADLAALVDRYPGASLQDPSIGNEAVGVFDRAASVMNALLLLAILAAALGVVNTTMISVAERRDELGLLRAVGATRRQVIAVVVGEAALIGLVGGALGLIAGVGVTAIVAVTYGGNAWGIENLALWPSAWQSLRPALQNGLFGLAMAPLISGIAAWLPVRAILSGSAIETMKPERRQVSRRRAMIELFSRGSIRTRFVLGTAILMTLVLVGLIAVVTAHARLRVEEQTHDALRWMVTWNAGMIELGLPDGVETLDFDTLQTGEMFRFDADTLLRFERLLSDLTDQGLADFAIADRDNVILVSLDAHDIGTLAPDLRTRNEADVYSERNGALPPGGEPVLSAAEGTKGGQQWLIHATAPVRNDQDEIVGSVRLTVSARGIQTFLGRLRNTLAAVGAAIVLLGLAAGWWLSTPLVRTTHQLAAHATGVGRGEYTLFAHPSRRRLFGRLSIRTRLTVAMVLILALMVTVLELVAIPIERRQVESRLKDGLVAAAEWIGQAASESWDSELSDLSLDQVPTLEQMLDLTETLDLARLQDLTDQVQSDDMAYTALVDQEGTIILSDQLALIGEQAPVGEITTSGTTLEETTWRDDEVWVISTPLERGGEAVGTLQMAMHRTRVEAFLNESRNLFRLTGLIAILAGILLAQAIGGAVTAPVRHLAAGARRVGQGDLGVQFQADSNDELSILSNAYNQMVVGLQEREWLRDMFGRFVSREVAEALRTGQVRLEGENRVVSVLFCDIRGFTARSEQHTPEEMVALLNEYLPIVVNAARHHEGTVNKFGGDSTLIIYGAPKHLQESAYQAVLTALEMRANLEALNARLAARGEAPIRIGVGINTGMALAGAVGPEERQEYTVIGDTVNLASRIEALNKQYPDYDVLISGETYQALGTRRVEFELVDLGQIQIRGKVQPVHVWTVVKRNGFHRHSDHRSIE